MNSTVCHKNNEFADKCYLLYAQPVSVDLNDRIEQV